MLGVSLVGYSGSLIKDAVKDAGSLLLRIPEDGLPPPPESSEEAELTKVVVGGFSNRVHFPRTTELIRTLSSGVFIILFAQIL